MSCNELENLNAIHRATYDGVAARFAVVNAATPPVVLDAAQQLLVLVGTSSRILELGCGHGRDAAWFEAHGLEVVAADLSAGMLAETRRRVAGPIVQLDMCALALRDGIFDGVWCDAAMLHLPKAFAPVALCEVRRVLKPRGIVFVSIQVGDAEVWETGAYDGPGARFFARYAPAEVGALIENAGFQLIEDHESYGGPRRKWAHYFASRE